MIMNLDYVTRKSETKPHFHNLLDLKTGCASREEMRRYHAVRNAIVIRGHFFKKLS